MYLLVNHGQFQTKKDETLIPAKSTTPQNSSTMSRMNQMLLFSRRLQKRSGMISMYVILCAEDYDHWTWFSTCQEMRMLPIQLDFERFRWTKDTLFEYAKDSFCGFKSNFKAQVNCEKAERGDINQRSNR